MIILNEDKALKNRFIMAKVKLYKGRTSNTLMVIEDVIDFAKKNPDNHRCICKCLVCGRTYPTVVPIRKVREKKLKCACSGGQKRYKFLDKKGKMLRFLIGERNKAKNEAVFAEDLQRVIDFDMVIHFLQSESLENYFVKKLDMAR